MAQHEPTTDAPFGKTFQTRTCIDWVSEQRFADIVCDRLPVDIQPEVLRAALMAAAVEFELELFRNER